MNLFQTISNVQPRLPGWCVTEKAFTLASLVLAYRPAVSLEIGVFGGSSFIPIALAHKEISHGVAFAIDPWSSHVAVRVQPTNVDREWWAGQDMNAIYAGFMQQVKNLELDKWVKIIRNESKHVPPPSSIGLLHVDGAHDQTAITDVLKFAPKVVSGGFCVMDDISAFGHSTTIACARLEQIGFKRLYPLGTGAVFQRTG